MGTVPAADTVSHRVQLSGGWLNIQPRLQVLTDIEYSLHPVRTHSRNQLCDLDFKPINFGWLNDGPVMLDYGR